MATVKTVSVSYERKVNLGDFNSAKVACTVWADIGEDDDLNEIMISLWTMAKNNVKAQVLPLVRESRGANMDVQELFLGLPVHNHTVDQTK